MPDLLIRGLSKDVLARLKAQAASHNLSMQAEAKSIIEAGTRPSMTEWIKRVDETRARIQASRGVLPDSSADILRELREGRER